MTKIYILLFLIIIFSLNINAQKLWTLKECIDYAYKNNIQIKKQELNLEYNQNTLNETKNKALPNLNAGITQNYSFGRNVDQYTNDFSDDNISSNNYSLNSTITLFNGFQTKNSIKQEQFNLLASQENVEKTKNDISLNIALTFLQVLYNEELVELAVKQLDVTKLQVDRTKQLYDAGSIAEGKYWEIQAQMASEELQVVNTTNELNSSYLTLKQLLDLDTLKDFTIAHPDIPEILADNISKTIDEIYTIALTKQPVIKNAEYTLESSKKSLDIVKGMRYPKLTLSGSFGTGYSNARKILTPVYSGSTLFGFTESHENVYTSSYSYSEKTRPFSDQIDANRNAALFFSLNIPIFNNFAVNNAISNSKIAILNSTYDYELAKKELYKVIQQAYYDAQAAYNKYKATVKTVKANQEVFRYNEQKFNLGLINSVDYNITKNNLTKSESELLQTKYDYLFKTKILDFYQGLTISL